MLENSCKDVKNNLTTFGIDAKGMETLTENQSVYKKMVNDNCKALKEKEG